MTDKAFTPALGYHVLTPLYDLAIAGLTRERVWRTALVEAAALKPGVRVLDVGCGTGSLLRRLQERYPDALLTGLDPDPAVLAKARRKVRAHETPPQFHQGFLTAGYLKAHGPFDVIVSSLVLHQVPLATKQALLTLMRQGIAAQGRLIIADYGWQRTAMMRFAFRNTVQRLDGRTDTQPNADGVLPALLSDAGWADVQEIRVIPTWTGSISLYTGTAAS
ncbi:MAG TPA: SAM-dependent methyltransferase [Alphaproteobacteria bacterium]|jgi:ubiquinone/menaquinone biosynthesis C-methylase UbiE|nr:SAM-dependent methyltransferase [Alphaproteobacteria bacterium]